MVRRLRQTLMDYMVIGISPTLIMGMVGSLLFFLLTVFYHGQYAGRLNFIFAMFTLAIVLIARISMENGIEYASMFAIPLAILTAIAMARFVQIEGPLADASYVINWGLIAVVWWSAHKLTWDCTFIDDQQDASGEGLLQGMGFDAETVEQQASAVQAGGAPSPDSAQQKQPSAAAEGGRQDWYRRMVARRRRPHTPGVWVLYYALAALPLFGVGHWLIPAFDTSSRLRAFQLICVYVACALGLLLTTSFLGLRRYLRQRNLQMPVDMAGLWLGFGAVIIVAVLLVCLFLPRPGASLSVSQLPFGFGSPGQLRTSPHALGNDGPERPAEATRTGPQAKPQPADSSSASTGHKSAVANSTQSAKQPTSQSDTSRNQNGQDSGGAKTPDAAQGKGPKGSQQAENNQGGQREPDTAKPNQRSDPSSGGERPRDSQQPGNREANKAQNTATDGNKMPQQEPADGPQFKGDQQQPDQQQPDQQQPDQQQPDQQQPDQQQPDQQQPDQQQPDQQQPDQQQPDQQQPDQQQPDQQQPDQQQPDQQQPDQQQPDQQQPDQQRDRPPPSSGAPRSRPPWNPSKILSTITSGIGNLLKLLFFVALACAALFFAWKHRVQVRQALAQLWRDLQNVWANLWGGRRATDVESETAADQGAGPPVPSFASYRDPFASGKAERYSMEELVRYSFEALEAWGREHDCPRAEDQTPLEYAQQVAGRHAHLGPETQVLADLYCRLAYGREQIAAHRRDHLRRLWRLLRTAPG